MANTRYPLALVALALALGGCASKKPDESAQQLIDQQTVSYTHLTLPTIYSV